ncbi:hypothetical protein CRUP_024919 [Coryphaenoides rupestris]|nr:hypothetical protein CRUP_024919 [Coryphaenoides rupestris]
MEDAEQAMDPDVSDSELGDEQEMEQQDDTDLPPPDTVAEGTSTMVLRSCEVVLDRLTPDEESAHKELEEREEMSRKGGKQLVSRIPTFQSGLSKKRPTGGSHNAETPLSKKDPPAELQEKAPVADVLARSKLPGIREPAATPQHQQPPVCLVPRSGGPEPTTVRDPEPYQFLALTPRPRLRSNPRVQELPLEPEDKLPLAHAVPQGDSEKEAPPASRTSLCASRDSDREGHQEDVIPATEPSESATEIGIGDEVPPWESEPMKYELMPDEVDRVETKVQDAEPVQDPQPAKEPQPVKDVMAKKSTTRSACEAVGENRSGRQHKVPQGEGLRKRPPPAEPSRSSGSGLTKATKPPAVSQRAPPAVRPSSPSVSRSGCYSFVLFCLLPATLLLVGGLGQHAWHYGLPRSVEHLLGHLELHYMDGWGVAGKPVRLVESMPVGLYPSGPPPLPSIYDSWRHLLSRANDSLQISAFYVSLRNSEIGPDPTDAQGRRVFEELSGLGARGVQLQMVVNAPQNSTQDTAALAAAGAEVREVDLQAMSGGILHTKLWVVDHQHLYLGSANMDWRSLSQVKEVGLMVEDCGCLAQDAARIFDLYWSLSSQGNVSLPFLYWPARFSALSSSQQPLQLRFNGVPAQVYLSSAPPQITARGRTDDLETILSVIDDAQEFVHISVMDYLPFSEFSTPVQWAACARSVKVQLMVSCWLYSPPTMFIFLQSLLALRKPPLACPISVKVFSVPSTPEQQNIPYARVNHAKYMTGSAVSPGQTTVQGELEQLFLRDWSSPYAAPLPEHAADACPLLHH